MAVIGLALCEIACGQNPPQSNRPVAPLSTAGKWQNFVDETANPLTMAAGLFNGTMAHITNSDPKYGTDSGAFAARFGASFADIVSQNFFGDFVLASAFHEGPRYFRIGPQRGFRWRVEYAVTRAVVIDADDGFRRKLFTRH